MEEGIHVVCVATKILEYVPPQKGKHKVPKDLDATKSALQTLLLPSGILFEGSALGCVPTMKFEYWDLVESETFPHLQTKNLMKLSKDGSVTVPELQKWLHGVEKVGILHLLWIPHFHRILITIFVIRQLLLLVHNGYLWLEDPIPITVKLIHRISQLLYKGKDPTEIAGKSRYFALVEAIKKKYKLEKKKRGYVISIIKDKGVYVSTQLLVGKVMRKCHGDEVLVLIIALEEQCAERVQFN